MESVSAVMGQNEGCNLDKQTPTASLESPINLTCRFLEEVRVHGEHTAPCSLTQLVHVKPGPSLCEETEL